MIKHVYSENGLRQLYKGYGAGFFRDFTWCINLSAFYGFRNLFNGQFGESKFNTMLAGSLAGMISYPIAYPFDTLKTRM